MLSVVMLSIIYAGVSPLSLNAERHNDECQCHQHMNDPNATNIKNLMKNKKAKHPQQSFN
jgi:hypothetical protein